MEPQTNEYERMKQLVQFLFLELLKCFGDAYTVAYEMFDMAHEEPIKMFFIFHNNRSIILLKKLFLQTSFLKFLPLGLIWTM